MLIKRTAPTLVCQSGREGTGLSLPAAACTGTQEALGVGSPTSHSGRVGRSTQILVDEGLRTNCTEALQALRWGTARTLVGLYCQDAAVWAVELLSRAEKALGRTRWLKSQSPLCTVSQCRPPLMCLVWDRKISVVSEGHILIMIFRSWRH